MPNPPSYWQNAEDNVIAEDLVSVQPNVLLSVGSGASPGS
jgi:hypothetical protein